MSRKPINRRDVHRELFPQGDQFRMMKQSLTAILIGASVFGLCACSNAATGQNLLEEAKSNSTTASASQDAKSNAPAMWEIKDENSTLYVLGTFHILPADLEWKTPVFEAAMADAENTITEADTSSPAATLAVQRAVGELGINPKGTTLSSILGTERHARFAAMSEKFGIPASALETFKPWLAVITVSVTALQSYGYDPASGVDSLVIEQATAEGDTLSYFETPKNK